MNEKLTLEELGRLLAECRQMEEAEAEAFVRTFLALVKESLARDKYVRIKGFGTFKLIEGGSCATESAEWAGTSISFVPDVPLRDAVNKPFAQFEAVPLKEGVHFDDICECEEETQGQKERQDEPENSSHMEISPDGLCVEEDTHHVPEKEKTDSRKLRLPWCMIASVLLAGVLIGGGIVWTLVSGRQYIPESVVRYLEDSKDTASSSARPVAFSREEVKRDSSSFHTKVSDVVAPLKEKESVLETEHASLRKRETLADTIEYVTEGTQASYTLRSGESLARVAQRFYGNKKLWPYLARYNRTLLPDPDNIPVGTTIRIPKLVPKK